MKKTNYPFAQELITDTQGTICKVVLKVKESHSSGVGHKAAIKPASLSSVSSFLVRSWHQYD